MSQKTHDDPYTEPASSPPKKRLITRRRVVIGGGAVAVGVDPVALDAWTYSLWGVGPNDLPELFDLAEGFGLGRADLYTDALEIVTG